MTLPELIGVGALGGAGALARVVLDRAVRARLGRAFPVGTLVVNLTGAFSLGVLVGAALRGAALTLLGTGFLGAYTTFSTWVFETHRLGEGRRVPAGALNLALGLLLGLGLAWTGRQVGRAL